MLKTYRIGDFAGVNYNRDLTSADFSVATRALNIDFVGGTGITGRPAFRTLATAPGSDWYTWCEAIGSNVYSMRTGVGAVVSGDTALLHNTPIVLRTPQAGSTNIWMVSQFDGAIRASATIGGASAASIGMKNAQVAGGLSVSGCDVNATYLIATPSGDLAGYTMNSVSIFAVANPGSGGYQSGHTQDFIYTSHCAVLRQSRRFLVGQGNRVWFSDPDAYTFTSGNYVSFDGGIGGNTITAMTETTEGVYVFTSNGIIFIYGETVDANGNALLQYRRISDIGCTVPYYGITSGSEGIYFLNANRLYVVRGVSVSRISTPFDYTANPTAWANPNAQTGRDNKGSTASGLDVHYFPFAYGQSKYTAGTTTWDPSNAWIGLHCGNQKLFLYGKSPDLGGSSATTLANTNGGTWVLDIPTKKWSYWNISPNCMTTGHEVISATANAYDIRDTSGVRYYFASSGAGLTNWTAKTLSKSDTTQNSDSPGLFGTEYWTGYGSLGSPGVNKRISGYRVWGQGSSSYPIGTYLYCDFEQTTRAPTGTFISGGAGTQIGYKLIDAGVTGSCVSIRLTRSAAGQKWHIGAIDFFYDDIGPGTILTARNISGVDT